MIFERVRNLRASFAGFLSHQSKEVILCEAIMLALVIGYLDYVTGYEISLVVFYAIPILMVVWFGDRKGSYFIAIFCVLVWWWADLKSGHPYLMNWVQGYNAIMSLVYFVFVIFGGSALKSEIELLERSRRLEREIIKISEHEQQRIGQDLHDGLCQYFAAISCAASSLRNDLLKSESPEAQAAAEIAELVKQGVTRTRNISRGLFPVRIDEEGLESALNELAKSSSSLLNIECALECEETVPIHDNIAATQLYRISQEALNNATRHGLASKVRILLECKGRTVTMSIIDNGKGMPSPPVGGDGMGMKIMDYRASLIGGQLAIADNPGGGTIVSCSFEQNARPEEKITGE
jgi:signal transduction histidine kinase